MTKGYFTLCVKNAKYCKFVELLAISLFDKGQKMAVIADEHTASYLESSRYRNFFGEIVKIYSSFYNFDNTYDVGLAKIKMHLVLPFDQAIFIDADSIVGVDFDADKCLNDFAGVDFTTSYDVASAIKLDIAKGVVPGQWWNYRFNSFLSGNSFPHLTPPYMGSSMMFYTKGVSLDFHDKATEWQLFFLQKRKMYKFKWFHGCIPDELSYMLAYAQTPMQMVGDKGYNATLMGGKDLERFPEINKMVATFSTGPQPANPTNLNFYEKMSMYYTKKYNVPLIRFQQKG